MARTTINSLGVPAGTITASDLTFPLTNFSSTGIDDNATSNALTIDSSQDVTFSSHALFPDNSTAIFGAGSDLQIYHDGSHSYIKDAGTGQLRILATDLRINNTANDKSYISGTDGAEITLYYNGSGKLETTSTGIDVTGTVTSDKAIVGYSRAAGTGGIVLYDDDQSENRLTLATGGGTGINAVINQAGGSFNITDASLNAVATFNDGGNVGIGEDSPDSLLHLKDPTGIASIITLERNDTGIATGNGIGQIRFQHQDSGNEGLCAILRVEAGDSSGTGEFVFQSGLAGTLTEKMRIDSNGRVGIGTDSPSSPLSLDVTAGTIPLFIDTNITSSEGSVDILKATTVNDEAAGITLIREGTTKTGLAFKTTNTSVYEERMRIDSSGNVGIGTTEPDANLEIRKDNASGLGAVLSLTNSNSSGLTGNSVAIGLSAYAHTTIDSASYRGAIIRSETTATGNGHSILFETSDTSLVPAERMRIDHDGNVGIGTTSPANTLHLETSGNTGIQLRSGTATSYGNINFNDGATAQGQILYDHNGDYMRLYVNGAERMRIDSSGRLLLGNSSSISVTGGERQFQIQGTNGVTSSITVRRSQNSSGSPSLSFAKDRGSKSTAVVSGDALGAIYFAGSDGVDLNNDAASIIGWADGTPSSDNTPGRLVFYTNGGSVSSTERMRIDSSGNVGIGTATATYDLTVVGASNLSTIGTNDAALRLRADGARTMQFYTNSAEAMRINSLGYVGIGDSAPPVKLSVETSTSGNWAAVITNTHTTNGFGLKVRAGDNSDVDSFRVADVDNATLYQIDGNGCVKVDPLGNTVGLSSLSIANNAMTIGSITGFNMAFDSNEIQGRNNGAANDLIFQKNGGNVGIGTSSPSALLTLEDSNAEINFVDSSRTSKMFTQNGGRDLQIQANQDLIINSSGGANVGIGTSSPLYELSQHVSDSGANYHQFTNTDTGTTNTSGFLVGIGGDEEATLWNYSNTHIRFATNSTERVRILADGGITFNGDTAAANALDDYEEGTWTPSPNYGTVSANDCIYTKIGNTVHVSGALASFSDYTTTEDIHISGLPFTSAGSSTAVGAVMYRDVNNSLIADLTAYVGSTSSVLRFYVSRNDGAGWTPLQYNHFDSGLGDLYFSITYRV